jgi:hypothetical protein
MKDTFLSLAVTAVAGNSFRGARKGQRIHFDETERGNHPAKGVHISYVGAFARHD